MKIEHIALNVADAASLAQWYVDHLGFQVKRRLDDSNKTFFIADGSGAVMVEVYSNPQAPVPEYAEQHPLMLHIAFVSDDVDTDRQRLVAAGAVAVGEISTTDNGDVLAMMRDPWGIAIQLVQRQDPMTPMDT